MKKYLWIVLLFLCVFSVQTVALVSGEHYAGFALGFNYISGGFITGGSYEYALKDSIGIGGLLRYSSWTTAGFKTGAVYIGGQGNFHFDIGVEKLTTYGGLVIGIAGLNSDDVAVNSGLFFAFQGGARYELSESVFATGRLSAGSKGYGGLEVGLDFKF